MILKKILWRVSIFLGVLALSQIAFVAKADVSPAFSAEQLKQLPTKDWITNGGSTFNQRYSPLDEINASNVSKLKGKWHTHLNGSGVGPPYSGEAQPIVYDGVVYIVTGANDVFALSVETGQLLWTYEAKLDRKIGTICCGWTSRGVGLGEGKVFVGQLDGKIVALDQRTGHVAWSIQAERWEDGYSLTSAPLYFNGLVITGFAGAEYGTRGRVKAFNAKNGKLKWTFYTVPGPGELGHDTWPADNNAWKYGGASVWQTPAVDPDLGLIYFSTGNPGRDFNGALRKGDNLFSASIVALEAKTGKYRWHFQQVHHDIWDYDAPSPVVLFDLEYQGKKRHALAQAGKTSWVYILDRITGEPLIGIDERAVPQEPRQATAPTQPYPRGDSITPQHVDMAPYGYRLINQGRIFTPFWDTPIVMKPATLGGANWPPSSYDPRQGYLFVCATDRASAFAIGASPDEPANGQLWMAGRMSTVPGPTTGIFAAMDMRTNKIAWRQQWEDRCYSGSTATAGNIVFTGRNDGRFIALDSRNGDVLWEFQTGAGVNTTASVFEYKGHQHVVVYAAGNLFANSPPGDSVWMFSLDGTLGPADLPKPPITRPSISMAGANADNGRKVYAQYCSQCHGQNGKGGHTGAPDISGLGSTAYMLGIVSAGKNGMPAFASVLKPDDIRDVVEFVARGLPAEK